MKLQKVLEEERKKEIEQRTKQLLDEKKNSVISGRDNKDELSRSNDRKVNKKNESTVLRNKNDGIGNSRLVGKDDFFSKKLKSSHVEEGVPVVRKNQVVGAKKEVVDDYSLFPDIPTEKKDTIFPNIGDKDSQNSFFDENEFNDLNNYMDDKHKNSWF